MSLALAIMYASILSPFLPIVVGRQKRLALDASLSLIFYLILISFAFDATMFILASNSINNLPLAHAYGLIEGILLILFFSRLTAMTRDVTIVLVAVYAGGYLLNSILHETIFTFNSKSRSAEALLMLVLCVYALYQFYTKEDDIFIEKSPQFWVVIAIMVYFSGALFSFLLSSDMLSRSPERFYSSWILHNVSNLVKNLLFAVGLWKVHR